MTQGLVLETAEPLVGISGGGGNGETDKERQAELYQCRDVILSIGRGRNGRREGFDERVVPDASGSCNEETQQSITGEQIRLQTRDHLVN